MNRKGFSLIELLAVIVILAIIALIATPIVLNIINDTKESSLLRSAEMYLGAVETAVAKQMMEDTIFKPTSCEIQTNGNLKCDEKDVKVEINGEKPTSGTITLDQGKIQNVELLLSEKTIVKNNEGKLVYGEPPVPLQSGLYDEEDNFIASWDELVNDYGIDVAKNYEADDTSSPGKIFTSNEKLSKGIKLVIDSSITEIGIYAFHKCTSLKEIIIPNSVTSIDHHAFRYCKSLKEIIIPNSVTTIGNSAFEGCTSLEAITIPYGITSIEYYTFYNCTSLKEIILPNSVVSIGDHAFAGCKSLEKITIPNSVTSIVGWAFANSSIKEITIPNSVTSIGEKTFRYCTNLKTINYAGTEAEWNVIQLGTDWNEKMPSDYVINYSYIIN